MKILGPVSVIALAISLIYAQMKWGPDYGKTFSRLIAQKRSSIIYYFIVFFIFLITFSIFMTTSFMPQFGLMGLFAWIYFLGIISQLICVTVPETGGYKTKIHLIAASIMSASALAQVALLVFLVHLSVFSFTICVLCLLIMSSIWLAIALKHTIAKYELGLQSLYFISYLGTLMFVSYTS